MATPIISISGKTYTSNTFFITKEIQLYDDDIIETIFTDIKVNNASTNNPIYLDDKKSFIKYNDNDIRYIDKLILTNSNNLSYHIYIPYWELYKMNVKMNLYFYDSNNNSTNIVIDFLFINIDYVPIIDGKDSNLGSFTDKMSVSYMIIDNKALKKNEDSFVRVKFQIDGGKIIKVSDIKTNIMNVYDIDFKGLTQGTHKLYITTINNEYSYTRIYTFKSIDGIITITSSIKSDLGDIINFPIIDYIITYNNDNKVWLANGLNNVGSYKQTNIKYTTSYSANLWKYLPPGKGTVKIEAIGLGNAYAKLEFTYNKISVLEPINEGDINLGKIYKSQQIKYKITDPDSGSFIVKEYFDNILLGTYTKYPLLENIVTDWESYFQAASIGTHYIKISVYDGYNTVEKYYRFIKAVIPITFYDTGNLELGLIDNSFSVNFKVHNAYSLPTSAIVEINNKLINSINPIKLDNNILLVVLNDDIQKLTKGNYKLNIICTDTANNQGTLTYEFTKSNNKPELSYRDTKQDIGLALNPPIINFNANDIDNDKMGIECYFDNILQTSLNIQLGENNFDTTPYFKNLSLGNHELKLTVYDIINVGNSLIYTFNKIDNYIVLTTDNINLGEKLNTFSFNFYCNNLLNNKTDITINIDEQKYIDLFDVPFLSAITVPINNIVYNNLLMGDHIIDIIATDTSNNTNTLQLTFIKEPNIPIVTNISNNINKSKNIKPIVITIK